VANGTFGPGQIVAAPATCGTTTGGNTASPDIMVASGNNKNMVQRSQEQERCHAILAIKSS
jgi:hypothetical protein